jgi:hypothetical protein
MNTMTVLVVAAMVATILALAQGIASMAQGGASDESRSHILMFRRIGWQSLAVLLLFLALLSQGM